MKIRATPELVQAMSLMKQLTELGLQEVVNHAIRPSEAAQPVEAAKPVEPEKSKSASAPKAASSPASRMPVAPVPKADKVRRARRKAQEQLDRIEERKRNAEKALMRLKEERQQRKKRAEEMRQKNARRRRKDPGRLAMKPSVPRQNRVKKKVRKAAEPSSAKLPALGGARAAVPELPPPIDAARGAGRYRKPKAKAPASAKDVKEVCDLILLERIREGIYVIKCHLGQNLGSILRLGLISSLRPR